MRWIIFLLLAACSPAPSSTPNTAVAEDGEAVCACGPPMTPTEAASLERAAKAGDLSAARELAVRYGDIDDVEASARWWRFAAERGDCASIAGLQANATEQEALNLRRLAERYHCASE